MTIYIRHNNSRKDQFRLMTTFEIENGIKFAHKKNYSKESEDFLNKHLENYTTLKEMKLPFELSIPTKEDNGIKFTFIEGENFIDAIEEAGREKDLTLVKKIINDFIKDVILNLPEKKYEESTEREEIFGKFNPDSKYTFGLIDLTLDNIIRNNNAITLVDYEWNFDFAVPVDFVIFRMLKSLITFSLPGRGIYLTELDELFYNYNKEENIRAEYNLNKYILKEEYVAPWEDFLADHLNYKTTKPAVQDILQEKNNISIQRLNYIHELITENENLRKKISEQDRELNRRVVKIALKARRKIKQITGK